MILFDPSAESFLYDLAEILYYKDYFGFYESANDYVTELVHDIMKNLPNKSKKLAPSYFEKYGKCMYYAVFKKNHNTQWYVFFNQEDDIYYVRYIGNNHSCSQYL